MGERSGKIGNYTGCVMTPSSSIGIGQRPRPLASCSMVALSGQNFGNSSRIAASFSAPRLANATRTSPSHNTRLTAWDDSNPSDLDDPNQRVACPRYFCALELVNFSLQERLRPRMAADSRLTALLRIDP